MVEDFSFLRFMQFRMPKWNILGRKRFASSAVPALKATIHEALRKALQLCFGAVGHLTTDIWSSWQVINSMSVTVH